MSATALKGTEPTAAPARRRLTGRWLWWALPIALVVAVGVYVTLLSPSTTTPLDPNNPKPNGARAMAQVLGQQGVDVRTVDSAGELTDIGTGTSVVITGGGRLSAKQWRSIAPRVAGADRVVLIKPGADVITALDLPADLQPSAFPAESAAGCPLPVAQGLTLRTSGERYAATGYGATVCFPPGGGFDVGGDRAGLLLSVPAASGRPPLLLIGADAVVRNDQVETTDHAALALRALGGSPRLVWWNVSDDDLDHTSAGPARWPDWVGPAWMVALLTLAVLIVARGRRLGRLVTETLPVVVHADETARARGQLYRKARDLDRAAAVLRSATRRRLASYLQVRAHDRTLVQVVAIAAHRDAAEVEYLLRGPVPPTEAELTTLAQRLRDLEREIRPR